MLINVFTILFRKVYNMGCLKINLNKKQTEICTISPIHSSSYELQNSPSSALV
jgi:hypothetical protein